MMMKRMKKISRAIFVVLVMALNPLYAAVSLPQVFSDGMVLQRDMPVSVWGWGDPGEKVEVAFAGQVKSATADTMGRWQLILDALPTSAEPRTLIVTAKNLKSEISNIKCDNVLVGEVWLAIGDHNFNNRFEHTGDTGKAKGGLRVAYSLGDKDVRYPADHAEMTVWRTNGVPQGIPLFFGENLQTNLNVPVGIIVAAQACVITPNISVTGLDGIPELAYLKPLVVRADPRTEEGKEAFKQYWQDVSNWLVVARAGLGSGLPLPQPPATPQTDFPAFDVGNNGEWNVGNRYCSMIHPLAPMALRGVIAHFGAYNAQFGATGGYDHRIAFGAKCKAVVQTLRLAWKRPDLPVYFLGVSNGDQVFDALRADQIKALSEVSQCSVVRSDDLKGDKGASGRRLAAYMVGKHYGGTIPTNAVIGKVNVPEGFDPAQGTGFDPAVYSIGSGALSRMNQQKSGALRLPFVFASNMVLPRDREVPVWGWGTPGSKVTVSFSGLKADGTVDQFGRWKVKLPAMPACSEPRTLTVSCQNLKSQISDLRLTNVLVGDVWLCSGQSNMAMLLAGCQGDKEEIAKANFGLIRHMHVGSGFSDAAVDDPVQMGAGGTPWTVCTPETAGKFSAVAYYFARDVSARTGVPIGVINSSLGGSLIEPWLPPEGCRLVPELAGLAALATGKDMNQPEFRIAQEQRFRQTDGWLAAFDGYLNRGEWPPALPTLASQPRQHVLDFQDSGVSKLYFGKIYGLVPFPIKGVLWYQGESNGGEGTSYFHKMQGLIRGWRKVWGDDFPFYYVQLANFQSPAKVPAAGDGWARLRAAQVKALSIPKTGMALAIDIGEAGDIHPRNKQDVGGRLALWALRNDYGQTNLVCSGPLYKALTITGNVARIQFDYVGSGLMVGKKGGPGPAVEEQGGTLKQFAIAGADKKWYWADAAIEGLTVSVTSTNVPAPVAVRYAFAQNPAGCNLYNKDGLPASPFRTDEW